MNARSSISMLLLLLLPALASALDTPGRRLDPTRIVVRAAASEKQARFDLDALQSQAGVGIFAAVPHGPANQRILDLASTPDQLESVLQRLAQDPALEFVSPAFESNLGLVDFPTQGVLVRFDELTDAGAQRSVLASFPELRAVEQDFGGLDGCWLLQSSARSGMDVLHSVERLSDEPRVVWAQPDWMAGTRSEAPPTPNDPRWSELWGLRNTGQTVNMIPGVVDRDVDADEAWELTEGDASILVVVLDNGVQQNHPDIHQVAGQDFTNDPGAANGGPVNACDNHGTAMAGCIAGIIDNSMGGVGVAPGCRVASARVNISTVGSPCPGTGVYQDSWIVSALAWAQSIGARVTSNSNSFLFSQAIADAYAQARTNGLIHFASTGNSGAMAINYPASDPSVLGIGAIRVNGSVRPTSNFGPGIFATAPGEGIWTADRTGNDGYGGGSEISVSGTSPACAYAAGVAALTLSAIPDLTPDELEAAMAAGADDWVGDGYDEVNGWGIVNARQSIAQIGEVWVDAAAAGGGNGSYASPYDTIGDAASFAPSGSKVVVRAGSYAENLVLSRPMSYRATGGVVVVGW